MSDFGFKVQAQGLSAKSITLSTVFGILLVAFWNYGMYRIDYVLK
ncbi:hypothetical protein F383_22383 [Gossypium arboreum]|uniref:Uncharacterized protein n=1 Tax=Gossypium arboreum TaxID=29729 RepID=A0A0B0NSW6_GOSAR|nr:hypothetical protein F383_22383 [Gossypium arboreum]